MTITKSIALVLGLSALYYGLAFLGFAFTGAGHGSAFFGEVILAPFSMIPGLAWFGLGLWPVIGILVALRQFYPCRILAGIALAIHYLGVLAVTVQTEWYYVGKVLQSLPVMVVLFLVGYFGSQAFLWLLITRRQYAA
jgi:hypothetical protein